jgi:hypothetical protein
MLMDSNLNHMIDDVTRRLFIREAAALSQVLYEHLDLAVIETREKVRFPPAKEPHAHAFYRRAALRDGLEAEPLPGGWIVSGNSRMGSQIILRHLDYGASLRFLSESRVTSNGVPHAGLTQARRQAWAPPRPLFAMPGVPAGHRDLLLLTDTTTAQPSMRIVRPIEPGRYSGNVACDFGIVLLRDTAAMSQAAFVGADEEDDLFSVDIAAEEGEDV